MHASVELVEFGKGRRQSPLSSAETVEQLLREHQVVVGGRRVAVNGIPVGLKTQLVEGDEVSVVDRVIGG